MAPGLTRATEGPELEAIIAEADKATERARQGALFENPRFEQFIRQKSPEFGREYANTLQRYTGGGQLPEAYADFSSFLKTKLGGLEQEFAPLEAQFNVGEERKKAEEERKKGERRARLPRPAVV